MTDTQLGASDPLTGQTTESHGSRALGAYNHSLDGFRWIAMCVMLAFHAGFEWGQGAAFSLSQFFTLSGFLITSLLLRNRSPIDDRLDLRTFWTKRIRRLMPAVFVVLAGILALAIPFADASQLAKLPGQFTAAVFYVVNWYFVFTGQQYVDQFASPSPVMHLWSLAVEEQFYLLMPLGLYLLLKWTRSMKVLTVVFLVGALASALWMVTLYHLGASFDRIYYGTDTRAAEFLVGAAMATYLFGKPLDFDARRRRWILVGSLIAAAITLWCYTQVPLDTPWLYRGGFSAYSLISATLILALLAGIGPLPRAFSWGPLPALGRITYGVYLIQWPIFLWLDQERTGLSRWPLLVFQLALIMALAALMYHTIELPIRSGRMLRGRSRWIVPPIVVVSLLVGAVIVSKTGEPDPTAALGAEPAAAPSGIVDDGVTDILIIADDMGRPAADALREAAAGRDDVEVAIGPAFACPPSPRPTTGCPALSAEWASAAEESEPDLVVVLVADWDVDAIREASGLGPDATTAELTDWTRETLDEGLDTLTDDGAEVLWILYQSSDLQIDLGRSQRPLGRALDAIVRSRSDVELESFTADGPIGSLAGDPAFLDQVVTTTLEAADDIVTARFDGRSRVLLIGDSMGLTFGAGLEEWARDTRKANVWNTARGGCALLYEGEFVQPNGDQQPLSPSCLDHLSKWESQVEQFDPDVVIVSSSANDITPRVPPGGSEVVDPEDPEFESMLLERYIEVYDILAARGARVVWLNAPCFHEGLWSDESIDWLNQQVLPKLQEARPEVEIYPWHDVLCPTGQFESDLAGIENGRYDGAHLSLEAARWVADNYAEDMIDGR